MGTACRAGQSDTSERRFLLRWILRRRILFAIFLFVLIAARPAEAYIGPGAGFAIAGSLFVVLMTMLAAIAAFFTWPVRYLIRLIRGRKAYAAAKVRRFVIVGMDGMDPELVEKFMGEGKLPNLKQLLRKMSGCLDPPFHLLQRKPLLGRCSPPHGPCNACPVLEPIEFKTQEREGSAAFSTRMESAEPYDSRLAGFHLKFIAPKPLG